jgi:hypothetical protein
MSELDALRREFAAEAVGPMIYRLLGRIVQANAPVYPPRLYSPSGVWDEGSIKDLLHDWMTDRLLQGRLELMLTSAANMGSLKAQLTNDLRQLIINRRRRDSAGNLYTRTAKMLRDDPAFESIDQAKASRRQWRLAGSEVGFPTPLDLSDLVRIAFQLSDDELAVIRYGPYSLKSSPILREPALKNFLSHLLAEAGGTLDPATIADVMAHRFALHRHSEVELEERLEAAQEPVEARIETQEAADAALRQLRLSDLEALAALVSADMVVSQAAASLGCSEGRISGARDRLGAAISELADSEEEALAVLRIVLESLF